MTPRNSGKDGTALLKEKANLLLSYKTTTLRLKGCLEQKNGADPGACLKERQRLMGHIDSIDRKLRSGGSPQNGAAGIGGSEGNETAAILAEMEKELNSIALLENAALQLAAAARAGVREEILNHRQHRHRAKGYRAGGTAEARFVSSRIG